MLLLVRRLCPPEADVIHCPARAPRLSVAHHSPHGAGHCEPPPLQVLGNTDVKDGNSEPTGLSAWRLCKCTGQKPVSADALRGQLWNEDAILDC